MKMTPEELVIHRTERLVNLVRCCENADFNYQSQQCLIEAKNDLQCELDAYRESQMNALANKKP